MAATDSELSFKTHLERYPLASSSNTETSSYFSKQAQHLHALSVWDGSQDLILQVNMAFASCVTPEGAYYLRFGLGRRVQTIFYAFRELYSHFPPDRKETLQLDEVQRASELLNGLYINIRGALDNFAWCLHFEIGGGADRKLRPNQIGLFDNRFLDHPQLSELKAVVAPHLQWDKNFKRFRDPAAHRVPLSAIPAILDVTDQQEYHHRLNLIQSKELELLEVARRSDVAAVEALDKELSTLRANLLRVGKYIPLFEYEPAMEPMPIYPTVPEDVGTFVILSRKLLHLLNGRPREEVSRTC